MFLMRMKVVLCLAAVLLLNLLTAPRILAKPIDEYDEDDEEWSSETTTVASITIVNEWGASNGKLFRTLLRAGRGACEVEV